MPDMFGDKSVDAVKDLVQALKDDSSPVILTMLKELVAALSQEAYLDEVSSTLHMSFV
jgi:hypothetical protein